MALAAHSRRDEARLLFDTMTRSKHELVMTCDRETEITKRLATAAGRRGRQRQYCTHPLVYAPAVIRLP